MSKRAIPTVAESGVPGYEVGNMYAIIAPRGTPRAIVNQIDRDIVRIVQAPD